MTDPVCHYRPGTASSWSVLTLDQDPTSGDFTGKNRLDLAVSATSDPTGDWERYALPVQNDGTEGTPNHHCARGEDPPAEVTNPRPASVTTRTWARTATASTSPPTSTPSSATARTVGRRTPVPRSTRSPRATSRTRSPPDDGHLPARGSARSAASPSDRRSLPAGQDSSAQRGTEFFLSSTLGDGSETGNTASSEDRIGLWSITNTRSLNGASPALRLQNRLIEADTYSLPPKATQKGGPTPLRDCLNDRSDLFGPGLGCWALFLDEPPADHEVISPLDSGDTRMQQVIYAGGTL